MNLKKGITERTIFKTGGMFCFFFLFPKKAVRFRCKVKKNEMVLSININFNFNLNLLLLFSVHQARPIENKSLKHH